MLNCIFSELGFQARFIKSRLNQWRMFYSLQYTLNIEECLSGNIQSCLSLSVEYIVGLPDLNPCFKSLKEWSNSIGEITAWAYRSIRF